MNAIPTRFRYAVNSDGLHACPMSETSLLPTHMIKVEMYDPRYGVHGKKRCRQLSVKVKSEDSTDSE